MSKARAIHKNVALEPATQPSWVVMPRDIYTCARERRWEQIPWVPEQASGEKEKFHIGVLGGFKHPGVHKTVTQLRALATLPNPVEQRVGLPAENTLRTTLIT
eukprot:4151282-Pyramimonas_sp.AAC.1